MTRYVLDNVRTGILASPDNKLRDFIEMAGKGSEKPFSYSAIEKTFYSKFIYPKMLQSRWDYKADVGENPRDLEQSQIVRLMTLIAEKLYIGKYDEEIGTRRVEHKVQSGEDVPELHLRAFRMAREEVLYCWISYIAKIVEYHFIQMGKPVDSERLFQYPFSEQLWTNIGNFVESLSRLPMWIDREASVTLFGGKQTYAFWQQIFETGRSPTGHPAMTKGINIMEMIKS